MHTTVYLNVAKIDNFLERWEVRGSEGFYTYFDKVAPFNLNIKESEFSQ